MKRHVFFELLQLFQDGISTLVPNGPVLCPATEKLGKREGINIITRGCVPTMSHRIGFDRTGLLVSGGPLRVGTARRKSVPGRVARSPFGDAARATGCSKRSICAGLIANSFSLKASGRGVPRRS